MPSSSFRKPLYCNHFFLLSPAPCPPQQSIFHWGIRKFSTCPHSQYLHLMTSPHSGQMLQRGSGFFCIPLETSQSSGVPCKGKLNLEILKHVNVVFSPTLTFFRDFFSVGWKQNETLAFESANACFGNPCLLRYYNVDLLLNTCLAAAFSLLSLCNLARDSYWIRLHHLSDGLKCENVPKCCIFSVLKEKHFLHWFRHLTEKVMAPFLFKINLVCICKQSRRLRNCEYFIQVKSIRLYLRKVKNPFTHTQLST